MDLGDRGRAAADDRRRARADRGRDGGRRPRPRVPAPRRADAGPRPRRRRLVARPGLGPRRHPRGARGARSGAAREADARRVQQARPAGRRARRGRRSASARERDGLDGRRDLRRRPARGSTRSAAASPTLLPDAEELAEPPEPAGVVVHRHRGDGRRLRRRARGRRRVPGPRQAHRADRRPDQLRRRGVGRAVPARPRPARASTPSCAGPASRPGDPVRIGASELEWEPRARGRTR